MALNLPVIFNAPTSVDCGGCTVCCDLLGVKELGKPYYARCQHLTPGKGCGAYEARPSACRVFRCAWHLGVFDFKPQWRPDQCGLVFSIESDPDRNAVFLHVYEATPGAADGDRALYLARRILADKRFRRLNRGKNTIRLFRYGADIGIAYPASALYDYAAPAKNPMKLTGGMSVFNGTHRGLVMPKKTD